MGTAPGGSDSRMSSLMQARGGFRENGKGSGEGARGLSLQSQSVLEVSGGLLVQASLPGSWGDSHFLCFSCPGQWPEIPSEKNQGLA